MSRSYRLGGKTAAGVLTAVLAGGVASAQPGPAVPVPVVPLPADGLFAQAPPGATPGADAAPQPETGPGVGRGKSRRRADFPNLDRRRPPAVRGRDRDGVRPRRVRLEEGSGRPPVPPARVLPDSADRARVLLGLRRPDRERNCRARPSGRTPGAARSPRGSSTSTTSATSKTRRTRKRTTSTSSKRVHLGDNWLFVNGGEFRARYENRHNSFLSRSNDDYQLGPHPHLWGLVVLGHFPHLRRGDRGRGRGRAAPPERAGPSTGPTSRTCSST